MKKLNTIKLMFYIITVIFEFSCVKDDSLLKTTDMSSYMLKQNNVDGLIDTMETCSYNSIYILLEFDTEYIEYHGGSPDILTGNIKSINVTSDNKYNDNFPEGSNLCEQMLINYKEYGWYIDNKISYNNFIKNENTCKYSIYLFFSEVPDSLRQHVLTITYEEDSGSKYTNTTYPINIKP
jgi:hypothetical protein